ncbi:hypothetical protein SUDANB178_01918 [Streptomyces sp. enrichment culture]
MGVCPLNGMTRTVHTPEDGARRGSRQTSWSTEYAHGSSEKNRVKIARTARVRRVATAALLTLGAALGLAAPSAQAVEGGTTIAAV